MRRSHVYERSGPRARRDVGRGGGGDYAPAGRAAVVALPNLLQQAEAAGAVVLSQYLGQALRAAEGIVARES